MKICKISIGQREHTFIYERINCAKSNYANDTVTSLRLPDEHDVIEKKDDSPTESARRRAWKWTDGGSTTGRKRNAAPGY